MSQSTTLRRVMREAKELSANPPSPIRPNPTFHAAPLSDNLHEWHFTILGPPSTPYAGGMYHGRIVLPPTYPYRPPSFRFLTPSGRFEVNREICLSISGFHEESWQPAWGVRLALTALRVFMTEDGKGQVGGLEASETVRKQLAERSRSWKCLGCETGGKTNNEIMKEWWECCRERGVEVADDGEFVEGTESQTEKIPEELRLGYRDELGARDDSAQKSSAGQASEEAQNALESVMKPTAQATDVVSHLQPQGTTPSHSTQPPLDPSSGSQLSTSNTAPLSQPSSIPSASTRTLPPPSSSTQTNPLSQQPSTASIHAKTKIDPSTSTPPSSTTPATTSQSRPRPQTPQQPLQRQPEQVTTPWLDRAISGLVIALLLMVLKKIFHV